MGVTDNTYTIPTLASTDSFYDWYQKENTDIIAKLNLLKVYGATSGDGVLASTNTAGILTLSIGGTSGIIQAPLIFNNTVTFNGLTNLSSINIQVSGITAGTNGYTFGTPIRITNNGTVVGYTASVASTPDDAEVLGVISSMGNTFSYVTVGGKINGSFTNVNADGRGLTAGCVYFLDPTTQGKITIIEPTVTGYVSKPLLLGLSADSALVLQYRGNYLNSDLSSYGSSGSNQIVFSIDTSVHADANTNILLGDVLSYNPTFAATLDGNNRYNFSGWYHAIDDPFESDFIVGVVTDKFLSGTDLIVTVQLSGYTNVYDSYGDGLLYLNSVFSLVNRVAAPQIIYSAYGNAGSSTKIAIVYDSFSDSAVIDITKNRGADPANLLQNRAVGTNTLGNIENVLVNGNFEVWQRSSGKDSSFTRLVDSVFADMWRRRSGLSGGNSTKSFYITRQNFSDYQIDVEGNSNYYVDFKAMGVSAADYPGLSNGEYPSYASTDHYMIGHAVPGAKYFDYKNLAVSFYAKTSTSQATDVNVYLARYTGTTLLDYKVLGTATLKTTWDRFDFNTFINGLTYTATPVEDDYSEIGIDMIPYITQANDNGLALNSATYISLASFNAGVGVGNFSYHNFRTYDEQLRYCQQFYYTTYSDVERIGIETMDDELVPSNTTPYLVTIPAYASTVHKLPCVMRKLPVVSIYSPYSGSPNEAFNFSARRELRSTSGTIGYGGASRVAEAGQQTIAATPAINNVKIDITAGQVPYDIVYYHFVADSDFTI